MNGIVTIVQLDDKEEKGNENEKRQACSSAELDARIVVVVDDARRDSMCVKNRKP